MASSAATWTPLESQSDVMNDFLRDIGVRSGWTMRRIPGLGYETVSQAIPDQTKVAALILAHNDQQERSTEKAETETAEPADLTVFNKDILFIRETPATTQMREPIALIHAVTNGIARTDLEEDSFLSNFIADTKSLSPAERGIVLAENLGESYVGLHTTDIQKPEGNPSLRQHVTFIRQQGTLLELNPTKNGPISHGASFAATFAEDAARVCQQLLDKNGGDQLGGRESIGIQQGSSFFALVAGTDDEIFSAVEGLQSYCGVAERAEQQIPARSNVQNEIHPLYLPLSDDDLIQM